MAIHLTVSFVFHDNGNNSDGHHIGGAAASAKAFVDRVHEYTNNEVKMYATSNSSKLPPHLNLLEREASGLGWFPREHDLASVVKQNTPCGVFRVYNHHEIYDKFKTDNKFPQDFFQHDATAVTYPGSFPPYSAIPWDRWVGDRGNQLWENIYLHEFLHTLGALFKKVGVNNFDEGHHAGKDSKGEYIYEREFQELFKKGGPIPWQKIVGLPGVRKI